LFLFTTYAFNVETENTDPETEVALNLICVDDITRKTPDIPIRPRPAKDLLSDVNQFKCATHETIKIENEHKTKLDSKDFLETKTGKTSYG
jgi:hypothetical protein